MPKHSITLSSSSSSSSADPARWSAPKKVARVHHSLRNSGSVLDVDLPDIPYEETAAGADANTDADDILPPEMDSQRAEENKNPSVVSGRMKIRLVEGRGYEGDDEDEDGDDVGTSLEEGSEGGNDGDNNDGDCDNDNDNAAEDDDDNDNEDHTDDQDVDMTDDGDESFNPTITANRTTRPNIRSETRFRSPECPSDSLNVHATNVANSVIADISLTGKVHVSSWKDIPARELHTNSEMHVACVFRRGCEVHYPSADVDDDGDEVWSGGLPGIPRGRERESRKWVVTGTEPEDSLPGAAYANVVDSRESQSPTFNNFEDGGEGDRNISEIDLLKEEVIELRKDRDEWVKKYITLEGTLSEQTKEAREKFGLLLKQRDEAERKVYDGIGGLKKVLGKLDS